MLLRPDRQRRLTLALAMALALAATVLPGPAARAAAPGYAPLVLQSSPIAYYRLGEAAGPAMVDSSGNANHGSYTGAGVTLGVAPAIAVDTDSSASFDGTGHGSAAGITTPASAYTLEAWVNPDAGVTDGAIVGQEGGPQLFLSGGFLALRQDGDDLVDSTTTLTPGTWRHVAATWDGTWRRLYVNGVQVAQSNTVLAAPSGNGPVHVASSDPLSVLPAPVPDLDGSLDEVAYYATALSAPVLLSHWVRGSDTTAPAISITAPVDNGRYVLHTVPLSSYSCNDPLAGVPLSASGIRSCTSSSVGSGVLGPRQLTVTAVDQTGNESTQTVAYTVLPNRYADEVLLSSPLSYYRLNEVNGSATMTDLSGNGHHGEYRNGVADRRGPAAIACQRRPDPPRVCALANDPKDWSTHFGEGGYGFVQDLVAPTTAYTLEAWIRRDDSSDGAIVGQGGAGQLYVVGDHLALRQTQDDVIGGGPVLTPGTWFHVAATWNGTTTRLYVNGSLVGSSSTALKPPSGSATMYVGLGEHAPAFHGLIDEVAYYPTALSAGVLAEHYAVGTAVDLPSLPAGTNTADPKAVITSPDDGGLYRPGKLPTAVFTCTDPDGPADVASCDATLDGNAIISGAPLDDTPGSHTLTVTAVDTGGNTHVNTVTYTVTTFEQIYLADSPAAYYRLGDLGATMSDASGNALHGEYKNLQESGPVGISGDLDLARRFWGDGGYGFVNGISAGPYESTLEAWAAPDDLRDQSIAGLAGTDELFVVGGKFAYRHLDRTVVADVGPTPLSFRQVVGVWDGATIEIYVDGVLRGTEDAATGRSSGNGTFYVGFGTRATWFLGSIDEVAYYPSALTPERIHQHFLADPPPPLQCTVPALRGLRLKGARAALVDAGCSLGAVDRRDAAARQRGRVVAQAVAAGVTLRLGRPIGVTVGR